MNTEEFTIQCESCGTLYSSLDEVCPYCGEPQPLLQELYYGDELPPEQALGEESYTDQAETMPHEAHAALSFLEEEDDIFAIVGEETGQDEYDEYDEPYDEYGELYDEGPYDTSDEFELEEDAKPRSTIRRHLLLGCLGAFVCVGIFVVIGVVAAYNGLQEQTLVVQTEAEAHYQRGQAHLANNAIELAIAEFEQALSLNPNLLSAREALHEAQRIAQSQPTPTSETRSAAAASLIDKAETQVTQKNWFAAIETLSQLRDLDPDYQAIAVSDLLYTANYQLGLQLLGTPERIDEALLSFNRALSERPDDALATLEKTKASLYIKGTAAVEQNDTARMVDLFHRLYREDSSYLDVKQHLLRAYEQLGDELAAGREWCLAEIQYREANLLRPDDTLQDKADASNEHCEETSLAQATGTPRQEQATPVSNKVNTPVTTTTEITATAGPTSSNISGGGSILFSAFNPNESRWEILSVPVSGGQPKTLVTNATMPAVSPNGQWLLYRSDLIEAEGLHVLDLTTGEDRRLTIFRQHILPGWGGDNTQFLFVAQEPGSNRWRIHLGFVDGKSEAIILRDGRTPDWSADNNLIAFQGTDAEGNNPGIYTVPFNGGEATRLTNHESDRAPKFSPDGSQLAFMSTRNGDWDIYTVSPAGSAPRQITDAPGNDGLPVWSPDSSQIAYVSDTGGSWAIYTVNIAGGTPSKVTDWDGVNRSDWLLAQIWWTR